MYFPALLDGALAPLAERLGARSSLVEPQLGRASGLAAVEEQLAKSAAWLGKLGARYERGQFTTGIDRDVTEGVLAFRRGDADVELPVAVVAERRPAREVELRIYYATHLVAAPEAVRAPPSVPTPRVAISAPDLVADWLDALRKGNVTAALATLEEGAILRDGAGRAYGRANGTLGPFLEAMAPWEALGVGHADDGRTCALEHTLVRRAGKDLTPTAGLIVLERGDSGLFRAVRLYDDVRP